MTRKNEREWIHRLQMELIRIYGPLQAGNAGGRVVQGILGDFQRMLEMTPTGQTCREEYRMEDGRAVVILTGTRTEGVEYLGMVTEAEINGRKILSGD
jgi:hypothetical protein